MAAYEFIQTFVSNGMATITLDRPPLNVMHGAMMSELNSALEGLVADPALGAIVFRGAGKAFSAGVDVADHTAEKVEEMIRQFHGIFRKLARSDAIIVAVVQGAALGGGCELACFADIVLASDRARFGQPEPQVGVFAPVAACVLPSQVGMKKAVELNTLGITVDAAEALRIGLVNQVYPAAEFETRVEEYLERLRALSRPVIRLAKRATTGAWREAFTTCLDRNEALYLKELMKLEDAHEGVTAFLEKRPPVWRHA